MRGALPVGWRILLTLRGDRRTLGLVVVMPAFIIYLFSEVFPVADLVQRLSGTDEKVPTLIYNGYGDYVAHLYKGLEDERLFM
jgi:hypothetical protein